MMHALCPELLPLPDSTERFRALARLENRREGIRSIYSDGGGGPAAAPEQACGSLVFAAWQTAPEGLACGGISQDSGQGAQLRDPQEHHPGGSFLKLYG
jgi:hypothetical protein